MLVQHDALNPLNMNSFIRSSAMGVVQKAEVFVVVKVELPSFLLCTFCGFKGFKRTQAIKFQF